ncbi:MAG: hypothetical protein ACE5D7_09840 [Fidelibacterota bacterium]
MVNSMMGDWVIIVLEGGLIQDISGLPEGYSVEIRDYDTEGTPDSELTTDSAGQKYHRSEWS